MSDTPIVDYLPYFVNLNVDVTFLVPTPTGYGKSIMDAIKPLRSFLERNGMHRYDDQPQGPENKVLVPAYLMESDHLVETEASLYRPVTKQGDPRIWIHKLKGYCDPKNLLALVAENGHILVINLSRPSIRQSLQSGFIGEYLRRLSHDNSAIANELLMKIQKIHDEGFLESITVGDPGVGDTLENALGIHRNPSKTPDYKGIELKASRIFKSKTRSSLFDQVPDWANSRGMNRVKLLDTYGQWNEQDKRYALYCTLTAHEPNTFGLYNELNIEDNTLETYYCPRGSAIPRKYVAQWDVSVLKNRLLEKHPETFWVKATNKKENGKEYFRYDSIVHTRNPNPELLPELIDEGVITVDFLMHRYPGKTVRDHGFPFKIKPDCLQMLFPEPLRYDLTIND